MGDVDTKARQKVIGKVIVIMICAYIIGNWIASIKVGYDVNRDQLLGFNILGIYPPWAYSDWRSNPNLMQAIPHVLRAAKKWIYIALLFGAGISYQIVKASQTYTSHGSAEWAKEPDIVKSGLGAFVETVKKVKKFGFIPWEEKTKIRKESGVVVGIDPFTKELMLHDGPEHMLLMAPTRSGKGVNTIIPTGLIWKNSIFFFDPKGELWQSTGGYRKNILHQKVLKFQPLRDDGGGVRWNPLAEVEFRHQDEISDIETIVGMLVKPDGGDKGGGKDPFWDNAAGSVLKGVIMHLMYARYADGERSLFLWQKEYRQLKRKLEQAEGKYDENAEDAAQQKETIDNLKDEIADKLKRRPKSTPLPCLTEVMTFLSPADAEDLGEYFKKNAYYPHITSEEFLERKILDDDGNPVLDENGKEMRYENPLKTIYGNYVTNLAAINEKLNEKARQKGIKTKFRCQNLDDVRKAIGDVGGVDFGEASFHDITDADDLTDNPFRPLLTHPKVAESFANIANNAEQTRASILGTATTALTLYQNPVVQRNTEVSDFCIRDLLNPAQEVSLYLVMEPKDIQILKPLSRLFINTMLDKLVRDMKFELNSKTKKQRLLLMLDEFPQLGNMQKVELSLAICAGYGIKMCIVSQDVNQLNKEYTKDNSIGSNCHVHIYFTPNLDSGGATAEAISKMLGKKTITTVSHSDGGGGFFKGSDSSSQTGRELLTPDEVMKLPADEEIVFIAGNKPVKGKKLRYYEHNFFTDKISDNPMPTYSDKCTSVATYDDLFRIHAADWADKEAGKQEIFEAKVRDGIIERPEETKEDDINEKIDEIPEIEDTPSEGPSPAEETPARGRSSFAQRTRGPRPQKMNGEEGGGSDLFPSRRREPGTLPIRSSDRFLIMEISKSNRITTKEAEELIQNANRRDVIHLVSILQRDIPDDILIKGVANAKDCSEDEALSFISENKDEAVKLFREDSIKSFIDKYKPETESKSPMTPSDIEMPNPQDVEKEEEQAKEAIDKMMEDLEDDKSENKESDNSSEEELSSDDLAEGDEAPELVLAKQMDEEESESEEPEIIEVKEEITESPAEDTKPDEPEQISSDDEKPKENPGPQAMSNTAQELFASINRSKEAALLAEENVNKESSAS